MEVWAAKTLCLFLILTITLVFGLLPFKLLGCLRGRQTEWRTARPRANFILGCLNSFGGGVFLGTAFFHLFPEVEEQFNSVFEQLKLSPKFPVTQGVAIGGFFVIMLLEHVILSCQHHHNDVSISLESSTSGEASNTTEATPVLQGHGHSHKDHQIKKHPSYGSTTNGSTITANNDSKGGAGLGSNPTGLPEKKERRAKSSAIETLETGECVHIIEASHHQHHHQDSRQLLGIRSFVLLLALSLHTIFEGLALGLQDTTNKIWTLLLALSTHKIIIAFTLGLQFAENLCSRKRAIFFMIMFSLMAPIGVGIGIGISESYNRDSLAQSIANATLQGLATGTFIYVTFFEILQKEVGQDHSIVKVLSIFLGCVCMGLLVLLETEEE